MQADSYQLEHRYREGYVTIEHASVRVVQKPWGSTNLRPWSKIRPNNVAIGELCFEHPAQPEKSALLLKLIFTNKPLSIQVHPNDTFAQSLGLPRGKNEAWYVLDANSDSQVAVGLKHLVTRAQLRAAIEDGSILELIQWRPVAKDDIVFVPAGTIHAIGAGLVIAEIQQRNDTTFRLFDHGRTRTLHIDDAIAVAHLGPIEQMALPQRIEDGRTLLASSPSFVFERLELAPKIQWEIHPKQEMWLFVIEGQAQIGALKAFIGETIFLEGESALLRIGSPGLKCLIAYPGSTPNLKLLKPHFPINRFSFFHHRYLRGYRST